MMAIVKVIDTDPFMWVSTGRVGMTEAKGAVVRLARLGVWR
jgi:hypothetical protein